MTIKRRIRVALSLMMFLPFILMVVLVMAVGVVQLGQGVDWHGGGWEHGGPPGPGMERGGTMLFVLSLFAGLIVGNGLLGWWLSSSIVRPLAGLREATRRIGDGDLDFRVAPGRDDEFGELSGAFETMRGKLKTSLEQQIREERARKELIAHVSHDLRTPIAVIRGYAEGLRDGVAATPEQRERYLSTILGRVAELDALIDQLFALTTLDLERPAEVEASFAPGIVLPELCAEVQLDFPAHRISLELPDGDLPPLRMEPGLLRRVLVNLAQNSARHGGRDGLDIRWRLYQDGGVWCLAVSDDGRGVDSADLPRLFEPFFQTDRARTRGTDGAGAGLGLAIVRKIMENSGGSARAEPTPGGGLTVVLGFVQEAVHG